VFTRDAGELSPPSFGPQLKAVMTPLLPPGSTVAVTGMNELASGGQAREGFGVLAETLLAGAAALGVLVFVFGSALALVPLLVAAVAIPACFLAIFGLSEITSVSVIMQYLAALIGLGVAIDYSLLLVTRWREELAASHSGEAAVVRRAGWRRSQRMPFRRLRPSGVLRPTGVGTYRISLVAISRCNEHRPGVHACRPGVEQERHSEPAAANAAAGGLSSAMSWSSSVGVRMS
jgi:hypothetical protein